MLIATANISVTHLVGFLHVEFFFSMVLAFMPNQ